VASSIHHYQKERTWLKGFPDGAGSSDAVAGFRAVLSCAAFRMPSSSTSADGVGAGNRIGSPTVLVVLTYDIKVEDEPKPGEPSGGMMLGMLFFFKG
jgi:hypothetical protein